MIEGLAWMLLREGDGRSQVVAVLGRRLHLRRPSGRWASGSYLDGASADAEALRLTQRAEGEGFALRRGPSVFSVRGAGDDRAVRDAVAAVLGLAR